MSYQFPQALIIQFARAPELGKVKTRMQPQLTLEQSLSLHCRLVGHTYQTLVESKLAEVELWTAGDDVSGFFATLEPPPLLCDQQGADLGKRMHHALQDGLQRYQAVLLIGSDCPSLTGIVIQEVLEKLTTGMDCVLGPATDGGYVLIGLSQANTAVFDGVNWGTGVVLEQTRQRLTKLAWRWHELVPLSDIDTVQDLNQITGLKQYEDLFLTR